MRYRCTVCGKVVKERGRHGHFRYATGDHGEKGDLPDDWRSYFVEADDADDPDDEPSDDPADDPDDTPSESDSEPQSESEQRPNIVKRVLTRPFITTDE